MIINNNKYIMIKNPAIIVDNGTRNIKAGLADGFEHSVYFPTVIGEPKSADIIISVD
jgi:actin-related protein